MIFPQNIEESAREFLLSSDIEESKIFTVLEKNISYLIRKGIMEVYEGSLEIEFSDDVSLDENCDLEYPSRRTLPTLYGIDKRGKERIYKIRIDGNTVTRISGLVGGKCTPHTRSYEGKYIGKKNETSPEEQALQEAEKAWVKQLEKEYVPRCKEGKEMVKRISKEQKKLGGQNTNSAAAIRGRKKKNMKKIDTLRVGISDKILPMKAKEWEVEQSGNPASAPNRVLKHFDIGKSGYFEKNPYVQWKLDGYRCVARPFSTGIALTTNSGKEYPWFSSLRESLKKFLYQATKRGCELEGLDGELYTHRIIGEDGTGLDDDARFSMIQSICGVSRSKPHPLEDQICLYVFDLIDTSGKYDQEARFANLEKLFENWDDPRIVLVPWYEITYPEEISEYQGKFASQGYEGTIIRARDLIYQPGKRSLKMRKYKHFEDDEFLVLGVELDKGVSPEHFVWRCQTENGVEFTVKPQGSAENRIYWYENYLEYVGKYVTVKYQDLTEDGIPRFPTAKGFRDEADF